MNINPLSLAVSPKFNQGGVPVVTGDPINRDLVFGWLASALCGFGQLPSASGAHAGGTYGTTRIGASAQNGAPAYSPYPMGGGLLLNGSTNGLQFGNISAVYSGTSTLSFSFWLTLGGTTSGRVFSQWGSATSDRNFLISASSGAMQLATGGAGGGLAQCQCSAALSTGVLTHVVIVSTGSNNMTFYLNARPQSKSNTIGGTSGAMQGPAISSSLWQIGYESKEGVAPISGVIDNLRVWTRALTQADVTQLFADPFAGYQFGRSRLTSIVGAVAALSGAKQYAVTCG